MTRTLCGHQVFIGFARKDGEEVEDVEKEVLVCVRHRMDESLVCRDDRLLIVRLFCCSDKPNNQEQEHLPRENTYQLLLGTTCTRNGKRGQKGVDTGPRKKTVGAYREIEVIWYHGFLSDKARNVRQSALIRRRGDVQAYE